MSEFPGQVRTGPDRGRINSAHVSTVNTLVGFNSHYYPHTDQGQNAIVLVHTF